MLACELVGYAPPFNAVGEPVDACPDEDRPLPDDAALPAVKMSESEFRRAVEKRSSQKIDAGRFNRLCRELRIVFRADPRRGGRPRKQ